MIYTYYHATSKEMLAMHVQQTKNATPYKKTLFQKHINTTHPSITCKELPPNHTLIIEANISSSISKKSQHKIDRHLKKTHTNNLR